MPLLDHLKFFRAFANGLLILRRRGGLPRSAASKSRRRKAGPPAPALTAAKDSGACSLIKPLKHQRLWAPKSYSYWAIAPYPEAAQAAQPEAGAASARAQLAYLHRHTWRAARSRRNLLPPSIQITSKRGKRWHSPPALHAALAASPLPAALRLRQEAPSWPWAAEEAQGKASECCNVPGTVLCYIISA